MLHHPDKLSQPNSKYYITVISKRFLHKATDSNEFNRIKAAYDIVGDPDLRAKYDRWRNSNLIIPFADFVRLGTHAQVRLSDIVQVFATFTYYSIDCTLAIFAYSNDIDGSK